MRDFFHVLSKATGGLRNIKAAMLLVIVLMLMPSRAWAWVSYDPCFMEGRNGSVHLTMEWPDNPYPCTIQLWGALEKDYNFQYLGSVTASRMEDGSQYIDGYVALDEGSWALQPILYAPDGARLWEDTYMWVHIDGLKQVDFVNQIGDDFEIVDRITKRTGFPAKITTNVPTRSGCVFIGWEPHISIWGDDRIFDSGDEYNIDREMYQYGPEWFSATWSAAPTITQADFDEFNKTVRLEWKMPNGMELAGNNKMLVYRNDIVIDTVRFAQYGSSGWIYTYEDRTFTFDRDETYYIRYALDTWNYEPRRTGLESEPRVVDTRRHVYVYNPNAINRDTSVVLMWETNSYPLFQDNSGNKFNIYIDNEFVCTVTPTVSDQTSFRWEHRSSATPGRTSGFSDNTFWTSEPLNGCDPHTYTIEGVYGTVTMHAQKMEKVSITSGSKLLSLYAEKGLYSDRVNLEWTVDRRGSTAEKTYIIEQRPAEQENVAWKKIGTIKSKQESLSFKDEEAAPGMYYEYRVTVVDSCEGNTLQSSIQDVGFTRATGLINGTVTYNQIQTAVPGVDIKVEMERGGDAATNPYHALHFTNRKAELVWKYPSKSYASDIFKTKPFSIQLWVDPDSVAGGTIMDAGGWSLILKSDLSVQVKVGEKEYDFKDVKIPLLGYSHITLTRNGNVLTVSKIVTDSTGVASVQSEHQTLSDDIEITKDSMRMGGFVGYVDEFRLWKKALTKDEILDSYDRLLLGNERELETYWTFDEGLNRRSFDYAYDDVYGHHNHHCAHTKYVESVTDVPSRLRLRAKTNTSGHYSIIGVPIVGNGTNYTVTPTLGVHQFSIAPQTCYVSARNPEHTINFTDVSNFTVSGKVIYDGTNYPVEGCNLYVDGIACSSNGHIIETSASGEFTISVPVGEHFIQVKKNGHVFASDGLYPEAKEGAEVKKMFDQPIKNLTFHDITTVNLTGRVVGGDIEGNKQVGFGLSKNNIGVATLVLQPQNETYSLNMLEERTETIVNYQVNPKTVDLENARSNVIDSKAWRGAADQSNLLFIRTDATTGEFSALVPPLDYKLKSVQVASSGLSVIDNPIRVDLTEPSTQHTDTNKINGKPTDKYTYHTKLLQIYHVQPTFSVQQSGHPDGSFGIDSLLIKDERGSLLIKDIHDLDTEGNVKYTYDYPLFIMNDSYTFQIKGYEQYENHDTYPMKVDRVPLANTVVTIENALSSNQKVCGENSPDSIPGKVFELESNQLTLDTLGEATYQWYGGLPNITAPYARAINIYYNIAGKAYSWSANPFYGIVLGNMPTGNNFVTAGPDKVLTVLRDPPGSQSFCSWTSGTISTETKVSSEITSSENTSRNTVYGGVSAETAQGFGLMIIVRSESMFDGTVGTHGYNEWTNSNTYRNSITAMKTISTSDSPEYDGPDADVFIGQSSNIIFGAVRRVALYRDKKDSSKVHVGMEDAISTGLKFTTYFAYTQHYIENDMIPNMIKVRNSWLTYAAKPDSAVNPHKDIPLYATSLRPDDPKFGMDSTYVVIAPQDSTVAYGDTINFFNQSIQNWKRILAENEKSKVFAYESALKDSKNIENYSFDAGSTLKIDYQTDDGNKYTKGSSYIWRAIGGVRTGFKVNRVGVEFEFEDESGAGNGEEKEDEYIKTAAYSYTLKDTDQGDAISVDVYHPGGKDSSPIFHTRGGQTSNPYEGKKEARFYEPEKHHVIMDATMQIEKPDLSVCGAKTCTMSDITSGTTANFDLTLSNQSEVNAGCNYKLLVVDETNPHGAQLSIDGKPVAEGRVIYVPFGGEGVTKSLQLKQSDLSILNYDRIAVVLASIGQSDPTSLMPVIADTVYVSAQFVPSASPVTLALNMSTMNTQTGTDLVLTMKDFDRNYYQQKAFRLQYKPQGGDWTTFHEYVLDEGLVTDRNELLPAEGAAITHTLSMNAFSAGLYLFRIVSVSTFGADEIYVYSNELELIKSLNRPRPLGIAEPADGILDIGDELSITFNEEFVSGELTKTRNFLITGVLNGAPIEHHTALKLDENVPAAQTEASVNLGNRDFSIDMWLNIHSNGLLFSHGTAKDLQISTDASGRLIVQIEENTLTSQTVLPHDKWLFLTLSYQHNAQHGILNASAAYDDVTPQLFQDQTVPLYLDRGPIFIGGGAGGAIHELLLWDEAHDIATALAQRSLTKNPSTPHLIGYWKMNEGEGRTARDYSRNRHMTATNESWYLNNVNKAIALDATHHFAAFTGNVAPLHTDDYAAELWFKVGKQNGSAQLFQLGEVGLSIDTIGQLHLQSGNSQWAMTNDKLPMTNNTWHHVLLNIHRLGTAAVYVDGERALTVSADKIGDLAADSLRIGPFQGAIDEIRLWQATLQSDMLASNRKQRLRGDEPGLSLYYPFEKKELDEYNQVIVSGTMEEFTGHGEEAVISGQPSAISYSDEAPALKEKPTETNVSFSFTASNTKIVIDIDEEPARIEGCMLNITVRDVRSNTGNYSLPATWTAFVHRNELAWTDDELSTITNNQSPITNNQLSTALINRSGTPQRWTLSELPAWLTVNATSGMLNPLQQQSLAFRVSASAPIGKHELTVYAMGNNGIETPLTLHITITGNLPDWTVNPADYENSMSVIAQLDFFGEISEDEDDIVAAFIGDECRGIAQPEYKERYDAYYLTMTIYGDSATAKKPVSFRAYKASTGVLYTQVAPQDTVFFKSLSLIGSYKEPVMLSVQDRIEQRLALRQGWNWISLSVKADDMRPQAILRDIENDVIAIKGHQDETQGIDVGFMTHTDTGWVGYMEPLINRRSYMIKAKRDCELRIVGTSVEPATHTVRIHANWGWPGYFGQHRIALADAFADADPQPGDIVRTQRAAAYYDDYEWVGSLQALEPGQGYAYYSVTNEEKWFAYPSSSIAAAPRRNEKMRKYENEEIVNDFAYPYNMILVGRVLLDNEPAANAEVGIFDKDECRAVGYTDVQGQLLMLVPGEDEATLGYKLFLNDETYETVETLHYITDDIVGSPDMPHLIRFGEGQSIDSVTGDGTNHGWRKVLMDGTIYLIRDGKTFTVLGVEVK